MSTITEVHMGEIMAAVTSLLEQRGLVPVGEITFRFVAGRETVNGRHATLRGGSYLTAVCETQPIPPKPPPP